MQTNIGFSLLPPQISVQEQGNRSRNLSPIMRMRSIGVPGIETLNTATPLTRRTSRRSCSSWPSARRPLSIAISRALSFSSAVICSSLCGSSAGEDLTMAAAAAKEFLRPSAIDRKLKPVTASILLTPAATEASDTILNRPTSPVLPTWVPPHSSIE